MKTGNINMNRINRVLEIASNMAEKVCRETENHSLANHIANIQLLSSGYAEPGYSGEVIALGNWNGIKNLPHGDLPERLSTILEKLGVSIEWYDEWSCCADCGKVFRTQPDSYSWKPSFAEDNGEYICVDCVKKDPESYLESLEISEVLHHIRSNTLGINPEDYGYVKVKDCQSGLYFGQTDNALDTAKELIKRGITRFLFSVDSTGQFDTHWSVWVKKES